MERRPPRAAAARRARRSLDLRLLMGRHWLKLVAASGLRGRRSCDATRSPRPTRTDPHDADARRPPRGLGGAAGGRRAGAMDGYELYEHLRGRSGPPRVRRRRRCSTARQAGAGRRAATGSSRWFERPDPPAAAATRVGCRAARAPVRAARPRTATAGEKGSRPRSTPAGRLDWCAFTVDPRPASAAARRRPRRRAHRDAHGAPDPVALRRHARTPAGGRSRTGAPTSATSGRTPPTWRKLLFLEFALVYSNDWFLIPCELPAGTRRRRVAGSR